MMALQDEVFAILDRRLRADSARPLAVALSGGGDSLALTLIADGWARRTGRGLVILTVDHGLQPQSRDWTRTCAAAAQGLGRPFQALLWTGEKPATGLPAAARRARHALLAAAARGAGARVVLMGHTGDDLAESASMRRAGSTTPDAREWAPSPAWPEGRGVFVLRPLLGVRRADLREWLRARGESWIEDPANADPRSARSRARAAGTPCVVAPPKPPTALALAEAVTERASVLRLPRMALQAASPEDAVRLTGLACVCAGGGARPPPGARLASLAARLQGHVAFVATLAGARIETSDEQVSIFREPGEAARGGLPAHALSSDAPTIWDGRFELPPGEGEVRPLAGLARRLPRAEQAALRGLPAAARRSLPVIVGPGEAIRCPALDGTAQSLVGARLRAAAGLVESEPG